MTALRLSRACLWPSLLLPPPCALAQDGVLTTAAFVTGALTSMVAGYIGMKVATPWRFPPRFLCMATVAPRSTFLSPCRPALSFLSLFCALGVSGRRVFERAHHQSRGAKLRGHAVHGGLQRGVSRGQLHGLLPLRGWPPRAVAPPPILQRFVNRKQPIPNTFLFSLSF